MDNRENMNQNEENQNTSGFAKNIGKKLDNNLTHTIQNIRNSEQYNKIMQNKNVQKFMNIGFVQKLRTKWSGYSKKRKYITSIVILYLLVFIFPGISFSTTIESQSPLQAPQCEYKCRAGNIGFSGAKASGAGNFYLEVKDKTAWYLVTPEGGKKHIVTYTPDKKFVAADDFVNGKDINDDGYIKFKITKISIFGIKNIAVVKGEL